MSIIPSDLEEQATQEERLSSAPPSPRAQNHHDRPTTASSMAGVVLGVFALVLASVLGFWVVRSARRLDRRMSQIAQQVERLNPRVGGTEQQSQSPPQQDAQAAASAEAAAQQ